MKNIALLATCALFLGSLAAAPAFALAVPERLVYDVSWTGLTAATAVHQISSDGNEMHITSTTRSSGWLNPIFKVDDKAEAVLTKTENFGAPKYYHEKINEGKYRALKEAHFDPQDLKVETKDFIKNTEKTDSIGPNTFDSLSVIYYIRSLELIPGKSIFVNIYDCKHLWKTEVKVLGREEVKTPLGRFKTIKVKPLLKAEGFFARTGDVTIWVTDDVRRIPVKMTTKVKLGNITATLVGGSYWPVND